MKRSTKPAALTASTSADERVRGRKRNAVLVRGGRRCVYCLAAEGEMQVDHVIPAAKGGESVPSNLVCACAECNAAKADWDLDLFAERLRRDKGVDPVAMMFRVVQQLTRALHW